MNGPDDERTLYGLAEDALGEKTRLELDEGLVLERADALGNIFLNDKPLEDAPAETIARFVKQADEWTRTRHLRPGDNPLIKLD
ncbi:MAG: hypothetical protein ABSG19_13720 [Candidatus Aminicenantales bacterium]